MPKDDYPTCRDTYATLRVYHKSQSPAMVSRALGLRPSSIQRVGAKWRRRSEEHRYPISGWFLTSKGQVDSYDCTNHIAWIIDALKGKAQALSDLRTRGWWMDVSCFWDSQWGHGGPALRPSLSAALGEFDLEIGFDIYFSGAMDWTHIVKDACAAHAKCA